MEIEIKIIYNGSPDKSLIDSLTDITLEDHPHLERADVRNATIEGLKYAFLLRSAPCELISLPAGSSIIPTGATV